MHINSIPTCSVYILFLITTLSKSSTKQNKTKERRKEEMNRTPERPHFRSSYRTWKNKNFIFVLEARHLLLFTNDCVWEYSEILLSGSFWATPLRPFCSMFSLGSNTVSHSIRGRLSWHMIPVNHSREPSSRDSASWTWSIFVNKWESN